ncbi:MAG: cation transporter [Bacteroidales bacterium]|jgi:copper chaperone CopZ|nr:cation transporter [Bacteroidales bacterium]
MRKLTLLFIIMALSTGMGFAQKEQRRQKRQEVAEFRLNEDICSNCKRKIEGNIPFEKGVTALAYGDDGTTVKVTYRADKTDTLKLRKAFEKIKFEVLETNLVEKGQAE